MCRYLSEKRGSEKLFKTMVIEKGVGSQLPGRSLFNCDIRNSFPFKEVSEEGGSTMALEERSYSSHPCQGKGDVQQRPTWVKRGNKGECLTCSKNQVVGREKGKENNQQA